MPRRTLGLWAILASLERPQNLVPGQEDVQDAFRRLCDVKVQIIKDRDTGEPRGFGFITFPDSSKAEEAMERSSLQRPVTP